MRMRRCLPCSGGNGIGFVFLIETNLYIMSLGLYSGGCDTTAFRSKAGAMSFAIVMTMLTGENGVRTVNLLAAQELFDFICKNVTLPDVEKDATAEVVEMLSATVKELQKGKS